MSNGKKIAYLLACIVTAIFIGCTSYLQVEDNITEEDTQHTQPSLYADQFASSCGVMPRGYKNHFKARGLGTGVLLSSGYILTNKHVIDRNKDGEISGYEMLLDIEIYYPVASVHSAVVVAWSERDWRDGEGEDIAVIHINNPPQSSIRLMSDEQYNRLPIGQDLMSIGRTAASIPHLIMGVRSMDVSNEYHRASMPAFFGNSGGGIYKKGDNLLVGLTTRIRREGMHFVPHWSEYVPATRIREFLYSRNLHRVID